MTDELDQVRLPLLAGILDISSHLLEENRNTDMFTVANMKECSDNITTPSCCTIISANKLEKLPLVLTPRIYHWLLQNGLKVLIAACDTFRSGAVEQLRVHVRNLNALGQNSNVELYERGYRKDAARIAKDAINYAKINKFDVVLIDTAGQRTINASLLRRIIPTRLYSSVKHCRLQDPRHIDGMILTKFDTVDDKVGAALSMTYTTGQRFYSLEPVKRIQTQRT
ncbi:Srp101p [Rhizophagus irregularis DAOM 197198w]|uniref:Srp101p n=1 Tax=Rhizophagus irregularis (strain DAOM 197198w) TaxID=1432141 RepID=A0A015N4Z9_RHIIW|nr:Srp101p [Rhizophagus irregularis DAOM 197198w]